MGQNKIRDSMAATINNILPIIIINLWAKLQRSIGASKFNLVQNFYNPRLTHLSLASFLWDIGKQNSTRCDAAKRGVPSGATLFAYRVFIEKCNENEKYS